MGSAARDGVIHITGAFFRTARNAPVKRFFEIMQFNVASIGPSEKRYVLTVSNYIPFPSAIEIAVAGNYLVLEA